MQPSVVVFLLVYQLDQLGKDALFIHHLEGGFIVSTVEEEEGDDEVKGIRRVFLEKVCERILIHVEVA